MTPGAPRTSILIVNGFDRRGHWGEYNIEEARRFPWIGLCLQQLERHTTGQLYDVLVWDNSFLAEHLEILESNPRVSVFSEREERRDVVHAEALDRLLREVPATTEYVVTLDTDSFPIRDGWLTNLVGRLDQGAWIAGIWRDEMTEKVSPYVHPSCMAARREKLLELDAQFRKKDGVPPGDAGQSITNDVLAAGGRISRLRRSNARNFHFLMAGVYGDLVYHHGAGSRHAGFWTSSDRKAEEELRAALRDAAFRDLDGLIGLLTGDEKVERTQELGLQTGFRLSPFLASPRRLTRRLQGLEEKLEAMSAKRVGRAQSPVLTNLEGETEFNVRWAWAAEDVRPGFTAVVRVKNEAQSLPWALPPLLRAVGEVVVVDNGSTDGTADVARRVAAEEGAADRLEVLSYPFSVARCRPEHLGTPAASVHSLAYFYNWSFSHVRTAYALKWDGDMVLTDGGVNVLRDLAWQLEAFQAVVKIPRYPLYLADDRRAFLEIAMTNREPWAWPNRPGYSFVKAMESELPLWPPDLPSVTLPPWCCVELKYLDADEFGHWSHTNFDASPRSRRKRREWQIFHALAEGGEPPPGILPVEAPDDRHVIDYVRSTWLPPKGGELTELSENGLRGSSFTMEIRRGRE